MERLGAFGDAHVVQRLDALQLLGAVDRAEVGVLVERIAHAQRRQPRAQLVEHDLGDRFLHEQARPRAAHVALVEEDPVDDAFDGLVERGVLEDDVRGLAAQFERHLLAGAGDLRWMLLPTAVDPVNAILSIAGVRDERGTGRAAAGDDVHDAGREPGVVAYLREQQRGERCRLRRLQDAHVAGGERRRELPRGHEQREVPRDHLTRRRRAVAGRGPGAAYSSLSAQPA